MSVKFSADQNVGISVVKGLQDVGFDITFPNSEERLPTDKEFLRKAIDEQRVIVTRDREFGLMAAHHWRSCAGVVLLRIPTHGGGTEGLEHLRGFLAEHRDRVLGSLVVVSDEGIRVVPLGDGQNE